MMKIVLLVCFLIVNVATAHPQPRPEPPLYSLTIKVTGLSRSEGKVGILLFRNKNGFPSDNRSAYRQSFITSKEAVNGFEITGLETGTYAVAVMHDTNNNGQLDTNLFGIPKEGYGVSNDALRAMGPPQFNECAFELRQSVRKEILMHY